VAAVPGISIAGTFDTGDAPVWDGTKWVATDVATASELSSHESDTTAVHGIANTASLETTTGSQSKATAAQAAAEATAAAALSSHESDTTSVHGITNTAALLTTSTVFDGDVKGVWNGLRTRRQLAITAQGIKDAVGDSAVYGTGTSPGTSVEVGRLVGAFDGETVTGVVIKLISITSLNLTNAYVAAYTTAGVQLAVSADIKASLSATGLLALPFTGTFVKSGSSGFYVTFKQTGSTLATVARSSAAVGENGVNGGSNASIARTGVTGVPDTPATFSANANGWFMGWY
jgi:hypothetical protein